MRVTVKHFLLQLSLCVEQTLFKWIVVSPSIECFVYDFDSQFSCFCSSSSSSMADLLLLRPARQCVYVYVHRVLFRGGLVRHKKMRQGLFACWCCCHDHSETSLPVCWMQSGLCLSVRMTVRQQRMSWLVNTLILMSDLISRAGLTFQCAT